MSDKKVEDKRSEEQEGTRSNCFDAAGCCGPMVERMMRAFSDSAGQREGSSAVGTGPDSMASCASIMQQMMAMCGKSRPTQDKVRADEEETPSCC